ncbi:nuclear transport factor 2 family protein [Streptomyces sp. A0642]|uniref:nuclear transport factor 2 family protein n=1 Tax=Streptomyces sp. A0642 TaxID=2563100 RepID=UPI0010A23540|nr:nuclear transport factor 2 family protein [Streptomyces sp. A0642]THA78969.1 nuclear transport factor 2 family protein [Streptomyces sp. A0642]
MSTVGTEALDALAHRYIAMWNEPDPDLRRALVDGLFAPACVHFTPTREVRGRADMLERVRDAHAQWVAPGKHHFRAVPGADGHHGAVRFTWEMADTATGAAVSAGSDFLVLDPTGLIVSDHQFIDR